MRVQLMGGPLDGKWVDVSDDAADFEWDELAAVGEPHLGSLRHVYRRDQDRPRRMVPRRFVFAGTVRD